MDPQKKALSDYAQEVARLASSTSTNEATYYPAIRNLISAFLREMKLPFDVRVNTGERRSSGGSDQPDLALYDGDGSFAVVLGEVKLPAAEVPEMARSLDRKDQVGRYLAQTKAVLLSNVRGFALVTVKKGWKGSGPVPVDQRHLEEFVELWPSASAMATGKVPGIEAMQELAELLEIAVTRYAAIADPQSLARILARQARKAKADLPNKFTQAVKGLLDDFGKALGITFEGEEGEEFFRSSLIQTAFYGLFAGWALWKRSGSEEEFHWGNLHRYLKIPFLGGLFYEFGHPTRIAELGLAKHLDIAEQTLHRVDDAAFFSRFTMPTIRPGQDLGKAAASSAILYFYEPFLEAFDPELRKELGVWYTPAEIVEYQVRRVDQLLREQLGCERGFADENVVVLDPCCGTGAYLIEVLRCVARQLEDEGAGGAMLGSKLLDASCRRIIGFEILTAPFVVAQLQLFLMLADLDVEPDKDHRPAIFLTNALTGWDGPEQMKLHFPELQQEHDAARKVKRGAKIIVVLGNPPYYGFAGVPAGEEELLLVDHYKGIVRDSRGKQKGPTLLYQQWGIKKMLLDDLYLRFFRLAESRIGERAEFGIVSFISNNSYLVGRSHPIMRESLLKSFHTIWVDNLHGNRLASEVTPWGGSCETVFNMTGTSSGIKVGTAITTMVKQKETPTNPADTQVHVRDFWGRAEDKRRALLESLQLDQLPKKGRAALAEKPEGPRAYQDFLPEKKNRWKLVEITASGGFEEWPALDEIFPTDFRGIQPCRGLEGSVIDTDPARLATRMKAYFSALPFEELHKLYPRLAQDRARFDAEAMRDEVVSVSGFKETQIVPYGIFPLDSRLVVAPQNWTENRP